MRIRRCIIDIKQCTLRNLRAIKAISRYNLSENHKLKRFTRTRANLLDSTFLLCNYAQSYFLYDNIIKCPFKIITSCMVAGLETSILFSFF